MLLISMASVNTIFAYPADAIPVKEAYISFAGAGGDFSSRTATFRVSAPDTTKPVQYGLRLYEVHLAKMIEVANNYCADRGNNYVIHWNYEADNGKVFMGQYDLTCQFVRNTMKKFGTTKGETLSIDYAGHTQAVKINTLNLNGKNAPEFAGLVQSIKPRCIEAAPKICPGDRLE
ncbi:MAG: hypothetical protein N5P05_002632 [Chroococcopsis gigantea SAG 12.99]|nr:hypothetical protein [Chroococcopsis gigantea SAG 12.99]